MERRLTFTESYPVPGVQYFTTNIYFILKMFLLESKLWSFLNIYTSLFQFWPTLGLETNFSGYIDFEK